MAEPAEQRVLTIQSHVVSGYVGNKIATFTLQVCGFETDAINSVQFSNHSHYAHLKGQVLQAPQLHELYDGLRLNRLDERYGRLLTGYANSESFLDELYGIVRQLRALNPSLVYLCDPVLGDNGRLYVTEKLVGFYRDRLLSEAQIITPNQFEAETLAEMRIQTEADALRCMQLLHAKGPQIVVITSVETGQPDLLIGYASRAASGGGGPDAAAAERFRIRIPKLQGFFVGTGDLFAASLLGWFTKNGGDLRDALEKAVATLQAVLTRTRDHALKLEGGLERIGNIELRMVQSIDDIRSPAVKIRAELI